MTTSSSLDLADLLIGLAARDAGCASVLTFDKRASKSNLFEQLA
jgi:predicted nucleic-acid-binding protein